MIVERDTGRTINVFGEEVTIKISSRDTGGGFTVFEGRTRPQHGPPLHLHHNQDEWWYVVEGEYQFEIDGKKVYARAGDTVFAPRGTRHTFQNIGTARGRTVATVVPGGVDLFFAEIEAATPPGAAPDPVKLRPIFEKYDLELLGPPIAARQP